jgi:tripeptide aminopeptidase
LVHLDTARGTLAVDGLEVLRGWDGGAIPYPKNPRLQVSVANYPALASYVGQDLVYGPGDAPFGLDDKLGLTHMLTLAWLLATNPTLPHPPLHLIARPDEEIGRMEALYGLAEWLEARGVRSGYTLDGLSPFEVNVANFNASRGSVWFASQPADPPAWPAYELFLGGVNTHGATAKAEQHRAATRFAAELWGRLQGHAGLAWASFASDELRDCDARLTLYAQDADALAALEREVRAVVGPHEPRGASWSLTPTEHRPHVEGAVAELLGFVQGFAASAPGFTLWAEDSEGWDGYSHPYRAAQDASGLRLDVRIRDFEPDALKRREGHLKALAQARRCETHDQYINMGPALAERPELVEWAQAAGAALGLDTPVLPIRGGTGVDPFLERGAAIANLGTGYFAPESEKEFTTLQGMDLHARWLLALLQRLAQGA